MMEESFVLFVLILVFLAFNPTRIFGIVMIAFFAYRYPLAALMVGITVLLVVHLGVKWVQVKQPPSNRRRLRSD